MKSLLMIVLSIAILFYLPSHLFSPLATEMEEQPYLPTETEENAYALTASDISRSSWEYMSHQERNEDINVSDIHAYMDSYIVSDILILNIDYRWHPASVADPAGFEQTSRFGVEAIPHILAYAKDLVADIELSIDPNTYIWNTTWEEDELVSKAFFFLACSYEMLNAPFLYDWIHPEESDYIKLCYPQLWIHELESYIAENGLRPIYPFISAEEAAAKQDKIVRQVEMSDFIFKSWYLYRELESYQYYASLITVFGKYAVPYILDYILSHEGQPLTSDEEMHLGILLHLSYRMLGVETTADWHMPAEPVASTTDPFPYTHELIEHLGEYGLEAAPPQDITMT